MNKNSTLIIGLLLAVVFFGLGLYSKKYDPKPFSFTSFEVNEDDAAQHLTSTMLKATTTLGVTRVAHAAFSLLEDTDIDITPLGVGASVPIGRTVSTVCSFLDKFSDVLLTALAALGLQAVAFYFFKTVGMQLCGITMAIASVTFYLSKSEHSKFGTLFLKFTFILIVCRIFLPISAIASDYMSDLLISDSAAKTLEKTLDKEAENFKSEVVVKRFEKALANTSWVDSDHTFKNDFEISESEPASQSQDSKDDSGYFDFLLEKVQSVPASWTEFQSFIAGFQEYMKTVYAWIEAVLDTILKVVTEPFILLYDLSVSGIEIIKDASLAIMENFRNWIILLIFEVVIFPLAVYWILIKIINSFFGIEHGSMLRFYNKKKVKGDS